MGTKEKKKHKLKELKEGYYKSLKKFKSLHRSASKIYMFKEYYISYEINECVDRIIEHLDSEFYYE